MVQATQLELRQWFQVMNRLISTKINVSALELRRHLGVPCRTAWTIKHKLMTIMASLHELAEKEKVDNSDVSRMANLTLLAPDIFAAIPDDQLPEGVSLFDLAVDVPVGWEGQRSRFRADCAADFPGSLAAGPGCVRLGLNLRQRSGKG